MPGTTPEVPGRSGARNDTGLVVAPFRGVRFNSRAVPDLAAVTSPPYDVVERDEARHLEALHPYNVVRLILPRGDPDSGVGRYDHAAATLRAWLDDRVLLRDQAPAIYVYEQLGERGRQRGVLAAVGLRDPADGVVLPHEEVMPGPVEGRLELMRATASNLEPILLVYSGTEVSGRVVDTAASGPTLVDAVTSDGVRHRLWAITEQRELDVIAADLAPRQALIADGHHRYAAYRRLQAEHHGAGDGRGPWDFGLALLVDDRSYPLDLHSISRVVEGLPLAEAVRAAEQVFASCTSHPSLAEGLRALETASATHAFLLSDGSEFSLAAEPAPDAVTNALPSEASTDEPPLDTNVLHALLLDRLWAISDSDARIRYIHHAEGALAAAKQSGGIAVMTRPVKVSDVTNIAARGGRMPRKSTSFGPKPRTGLVLRLLDTADGDHQGL